MKVLEGLVWWLLLVLLWSATASPITVAEVVTAGLCAVPCALAARAGRCAAGARWQVRTHWVRWAPTLPVAVVADTVRLFGLLLRGRVRQPGAERRVRLTQETDPAVAVTHRALAAVVIAAAPGSVVLGIDHNELCLHELGAGRPRLDDVVAR
jgi:multisubunit Na+/H+ antiporter MnhE subunit